MDDKHIELNPYMDMQTHAANDNIYSRAYTQVLVTRRDDYYA